jgi:hypothetical protein
MDQTDRMDHVSCWILTVLRWRAKISVMKDEPSGIEPGPARDEWVRVNPDQPAYQKLHLCEYLAELPELGTEEPGKEQNE